MHKNNLFLTMGFSPGYLKKIGINFFVAAGIMAFLSVIDLVRINNVRLIITFLFFLFGLTCSGVACLKLKYHKEHWEKIGEPELAPIELRRAGRHCGIFGLLIMFFVLTKSLLLNFYPDWYDITAIVVPILIFVYLYIESKRRENKK